MINFNVYLMSINNTLRLLINMKRVDIKLKFINYENFSIEKKMKKNKTMKKSNRLNYNNFFKRYLFKSNKS